MKKRGFKSCLLWAVILIIVLSLSPLVFKFGYCHSWWGKGNLLLRSLWLCSCSPEFEQSLYPENVEILVSACECGGQGATSPHVQFDYFGMLVSTCTHSPKVYGVPGGRLLFVDDRLINLYTGEITPFNISSPRSAIWLSEDLIWTLGGDYYLTRRSDQESIHVPHISENASLWNPIQAMKEAEKVFVVDTIFGFEVIILGSDFWSHPELNFFFYEDESHFPDIEQMGVDVFLEDNGISYEQVYVGPLSPSSRFHAKPDGIYASDTGEKLLDYGLRDTPFWVWRSTSSGPALNLFSPCCWRSDERVLILASNMRHSNAPVLAFSLTRWDWGAFGVFFSLPQPVLKVNIPEEVIDAVPMPAP